MNLNDIIKYSLVFLFGSLVSYFLSQFSYLNVDTELNVWESIIAAISILIGLFIAVNLQKKYNRNQNLYNYLVSRLDGIWSDFNVFHDHIESTDQIELARVTKTMRSLQQRNSDFDKLLAEIEGLQNQFESLSDELQQLFEKSLISENIVYYDGKKEEILGISKKITENFIMIYREINNKV